MAIDGPTIAREEEEDGDDDCGDLEPFFYDEATTPAKAAAAAEKRSRQEEDASREAAARAERWAAHEAVIDRITERDPETGAVVYNRYHEEDFDIDEVSPLPPPMRFTAAAYSHPGEAKLYVDNMVNVLAIRIFPSDDEEVIFPINVYGSVIARDDLDRKCLSLFRRSRDHPQLITSKDESLILTGPHQRLVLEDVYFEIDLKLKDEQSAADGGEEDKRLSKGLLMLNGIWLETTLLLEQKLQSAVRSATIDRSRLNRLCSVQITYTFVSDAVEATVSVQLLQGHFHGQITACTSRIKDSILLHDSTLVV